MEPIGTGKTKDAGYQTGVRHTYPVSLHDAWNFMFSAKGLHAWLGYDGKPVWAKGRKFVSRKGISVCIRIFNELSHIRVQYKKKDWENTSTLQLRFIRAKTGTTLSFHHERLSDAQQREEMRRHWEKVVETLKTYLIPTHENT